MFVVMSAHAIVSFVFSSITEANGGSAGGLSVTIGTIISFLLGLLGIAAVVGVLIGIPVGIYLLATDDKPAVVVKK